ncbi:hypothetical protein F5X97DRAFT_34832 [Nemania serpens]|nr:hypothetical protein F5X97DRAFT_34832 [Nemania serpens]
MYVACLCLCLCPCLSMIHLSQFTSWNIQTSRSRFLSVFISLPSPPLLKSVRSARTGPNRFGHLVFVRSLVSFPHARLASYLSSCLRICDNSNRPFLVGSRSPLDPLDGCHEEHSPPDRPDTSKT